MSERSVVSGESVMSERNMTCEWGVCLIEWSKWEEHDHFLSVLFCCFGLH